MMRKLLLLFPLLLPLLAMQDGGPKVDPLWETPQNLKTPESVLYLPVTNTLLVANINGNSNEKDGNGFLTELNMDGSFKRQWPAQLDAPKGMGVWQEHVYVTDIDRLVKINVTSGETVKAWKVPDAVFLNDVAVSSDGTVFFTDMRQGNIHQLKRGKVSLFASGLDRPNGLFVENGQVLVGLNGKIQRSPVAAAKWQLITNETDGSVDGLEGDGKGGYFFSDWKGAVRHINTDGEIYILFDHSAQKINAADICYIPAQQMLLVPTFFDNRVVAYRVQ